MLVEFTVNDRVESLINERFNGNKSAFAIALGLRPSIMSTYFGRKRRSKLSVEMVAKIVRVIGVDANWLILGDEAPSPAGNTITTGDNSAAAIGGNATNNGAENEKVRYLEALLEEKERLIRVLMEERARGSGDCKKE